MSYTELQATSNFSFLRGASHPGELVEQGLALGYSALAITDRNSFAGIVRAYAAAKEKDIRIIPACRLDLMDGPGLLAYPTDQSSYSLLSSLLTKGNLRTEKGSCHLYKYDVYEHSKGLKFIALPPVTLNEKNEFATSFHHHLEEYREALGSELYLGMTPYYQGNDQKRMFRLGELSAALDLPLAATGDVYYHDSSRRELQDVLTCVREKCTIHNAGFRLHQNAERYMKPVDEIRRLFRGYPEALRGVSEIAEACRFSLGSLKYCYPEELTSEGRTPMQELSFLTWKGADEQFEGGIPANIRSQIEEELSFIGRKNLPDYFLTVHDLVRFARSKNILCQGRGSAANSVVCYCLGITSVNPKSFKLLFARFMSDARDEPPDIDVDFEHERREEVIQYIYEKYGRDRAAIVATVTQLHFKGAVRDVAKVMGLSADTVNRLSASVWHHEEVFDDAKLAEQGLNPLDPHLQKTLELTAQMIGFPRQLGQHTGGFVITRGRLSDLCPILNARMEDRTCIEWNKDDIDTLGFLKVDVLALGMLTCIRKAFDLVKAHHGRELTLANIPEKDADVYEMISHADTIGVFQIESRAQMSMLPRLRPKCFYDLVIEVAIVRPGPIQGDMVHPYLRRRNGEEEVDYPSEELKEILERTKGVPLFQEQAMEIAIVAAGFTPAEADGLRRSMATFKAKGLVSQFEKKLVEGMVAKGYEEAFARRVFRQLEGFGSYGFPESHAVSFALLVYVSSWIKYHYPDAFAVALLNSLPMGFYQPAQIVADARKHGVDVRPADVNASSWDNMPEERSGKYFAIRLGLRQIKGMNKEDADALVSCRKIKGRLSRITTLFDHGLPLTALEKLADADAFRSLGLDRREALWEVIALTDTPAALFSGQLSESAFEADTRLPLMTPPEHVIQDYAATSLSLKAHPVSFVREQLGLLRVLSSVELDQKKDGDPVKVAGLVLVRQRPGTASGICFITLEDETGIVNLVVFRDLFDQYRREILGARLLMAEGKLQREGEVVHVIVKRCFNLTPLLNDLIPGTGSDVPVMKLSRADERSEPVSGGNKGTEEMRTLRKKNIFYKGRNFR